MGTQIRLLDTDCDGVLSPAEIEAAPSILSDLVNNGDGYLRDPDYGGGHYSWAAWAKRNCQDA